MKGKSWDRVGSRFADRYDLLEVLGSGGMGAVYKAKHAFTGSPVALKILHAGVARSASARERFLREAQAPTSIGHPGIVKVSDAGVADDGTLYLALELLDGVDLATAIERGNVDGATAVSVCIDLLDCLGAAHTTGLVHRDIKPENVFLCSSQSEGMRVRLLDFGITRSVKDTEADKLTQTGSVLGTPHYMSPEQARGQPVDPRSDLYSVGGMLFYALTGRPAFVAENYNLLIVAIVTHPAPTIRSVRSEVPIDVAAVIDRAMAADPTVRFQTAAEMREALLACAPVSLSPVSIAPSIALEPTMLSDDGFSGSRFDTGRSVETPHSRPPSARIAPTVASAPSNIRPPTTPLSRVGTAPSNTGNEARNNRGFLWLVAAIGLLSIAAGGAVTLRSPSRR